MNAMIYIIVYYYLLLLIIILYIFILIYHLPYGNQVHITNL